jgi:hypothetical protein
MTEPTQKPNILTRNPWIFVVLAFALLLTAWGSLISLAKAHRPEEINVQHTQP